MYFTLSGLISFPISHIILTSLKTSPSIIQMKNSGAGSPFSFLTKELVISNMDSSKANAFLRF